jgi:small subunit ribosomal protein S17
MTVSTRPAEAAAHASRRKTKVGRVVSDKMDKTIVVAVERLARHRVYKRVMRVTTKFKAHDEENAASVGDRVLIEEWRPMSREKRWRLLEIISRAGTPVELVSEEPETTEAISAVAHPGRRAKEEAEAAAAEGKVAAESEATAEAESGSAAAATDAAGAGATSSAVEGETAAGASPSDGDAAGAGASAPDREQPRRAASAAAERSGREKPAPEEAAQ